MDGKKEKIEKAIDFFENEKVDLQSTLAELVDDMEELKPFVNMHNIELEVLTVAKKISNRDNIIKQLKAII
jgi:NADH/NAD ratio-sensing transcriptional regulator Rex